MNWLRDKLRAWLAPDTDYLKMRAELEETAVRLSGRLDIVQGELDGFRAALKAKVQTSVRVVPRIPDFETSQATALEEFRDRKKEN